MPKFAANLTMLFTEVSFMERFALAKKAGFKFIEYLFPYEYSLADLRKQLVDHDLKQVLFNLPAGDWAKGERGIASHPDRIEEFRAGVFKAIEYAEGLGVDRLNCLAGNRLTQFSEEEQLEVLVDNVKFAAKVLGEKGLQLVIEPINPYDMPKFLLNRTEKALALLDKVNMPNVFIQYDVYHAQRSEGELVNTIRKNIARIGHIQIADNPGRHQPGTGEINYPFVLAAIDESGYQGYIGLEYVPDGDTQSSLAWIKDFGYKL